MLRYLNLLFLSVVLVSLVACSAPDTNTVRENTVDNSGVSSVPGYQPPAGLPSDIGDLFEKLTYNYWAGETAVSKDFFYLKKDNSSSNGHEMYHIEILTQASPGRPAQAVHFYTLKDFAGSSISNGVWKAHFYLPDSDGKLNLNKKMGLEMKFLTLTKAEVKFYPKISDSGLKDYGTFIVTSQ